MVAGDDGECACACVGRPMPRLGLLWLMAYCRWLDVSMMSRLMCQLSPLVREWGGSVNDVLTDVSTVLDKTAGCWCQLCPDAGHCWGRFVISRDIVDIVSRDMVDTLRRRVRTLF